LSVTSSGKIPYKRIGKSCFVNECGCNSVMCTYTFGDIFSVISNSTCVSFFVVATHFVLSTFEPFSTDNNARQPSLEGKDIFAFSPTVYFCLSLVKSNIVALSALPPLVFPDQYG